jgi:hypothetical protein
MEAPTIDLFTELTTSIADAYAKLGHTRGWRFLYTPARTLTPNAPILFAGLNPGGCDFECPERSVEAGNAYRVQPWGKNNRPTPLQNQVCKLYELTLIGRVPQPIGHRGVSASRSL